ncbi:MAG: hypothetical protein AB7F59_05940 [Bdellovibrionales bacterium]
MSKFVLIVGLFLSLNASASDIKKFSQAERAHFTISSVSIEEEKLSSDSLFYNTCQRITKRGLGEQFDWETIVNIGQQVWDIIVKNAPNVNVELQSASALPADTKRWFDLDCWQWPQAKAYRVNYKNAFGINVVDFTYKVIYTYGGQLDGRGQYLSQVMIVPTNLKVAWGFTFDAKARVDNVVNAGSRSAPVGAIQISMDWTIKTPIKYVQERETYYVRGDGQFQRL